MNYVFPKSEYANGKYTPFKIEETKIEQIKKQLEQITKKPVQFVLQTEHFYRDLVKVEENLENYKQKELYFKKMTIAKYNQTTKNLHITYTTEPIEEFNFPKLNNYHHVETKEIYRYGDVMLIKNNIQWTICIKYESKESVEKLYEQVLKII
jgi:hypothetical protein